MGAAFDDALIYSVATVIGTEGRAFGNNNHSGVSRTADTSSDYLLTTAIA